MCSSCSSPNACLQPFLICGPTESFPGRREPLYSFHWAWWLASKNHIHFMQMSSIFFHALYTSTGSFSPVQESSSPSPLCLDSAQGRVLCSIAVFLGGLWWVPLLCARASGASLWLSEPCCFQWEVGMPCTFSEKTWNIPLAKDIEKHVLFTIAKWSKISL